MVNKSGDFYVLYAHKRWHLVTTMNQFIRTVHFMDEAGTRRYFENFMAPPVIQLISEMFPGFAEEVTKKILPNAKAYLPFLERGELQAFSGSTTDTIQISNIGARDKKFITALNRIMKHEALGFALQFTK